MAPKYVIIVRERYETYGLKAWQFLKQGREIWSTLDANEAKQKYLETLKKYPYDCVKIMHDLTPLIDADFHGCTPGGDTDPTYDPMNEALNIPTSPVYIDEMLLMEGFEPYDVDVEDDSGYDPNNQQVIVNDGSYSQEVIETGTLEPVDVDVEGDSHYDPSQQQADLSDGTYSQEVIETGSLSPVDVDEEDTHYDPLNQQADLSDDGFYSNESIASNSIVPVDVDNN